MFSDLNNQSLNKIPTSNAKAYPSVNSPNDGGFNSEENLRWLTKAIANKPFIIGQTDADVNRSFDSNGQGGNGVYTAPGFFSIDGYIGKIALQSDISFDNTGTTTSYTNNTQNIQRFIQGLTNQGNNDAIETELGYLLFTDYRPSVNDTEEEAAAIKSAWETANNNRTCVGYVWNVYKDSYKDVLDTSVSGKVSYTFDNGSKNTINVISELLPNDKSDYIDWIENTLIENHTIISGDSFAIVDTGEITIFYPIFFDSFNRFVKTGSQEVITTTTIVFTDIYGIWYYYAPFSYFTNSGGSRSYPNTTCTLIDMDYNSPLAQVTQSGFDDCKTKTYPTYLYNYVSSLYAQDEYGIYRRKPVNDLNDSSYSKGYFPLTLDSIKTSGASDSSVFHKYTLNDLLNYIPLTHPDIPFIHNNMSYYCLNNVDNTYKYEGRIPIAFMTSEGSLCPDGFVYTANNGSTEPTLGDGYVGISTRYPVEGYLHFAKRYYLENLKIPQSARISNPSEDEIKAVTVEEMCANSDFAQFYNDTFSEAISIYLHLAYCSMLDNVVAPSFSYSSDYKNIKSVGCGNKLWSVVGSPTVSQDANKFFTRQPYSFQDPLDQNNSVQTTVSYHNDITSDNYKLQSAVSGVSAYDDGLLNYCTKLDTDKIISMTEDPIYFIRFCVGDADKCVDWFNLYYINLINGNYKLTHINKITPTPTGAIYSVRYLRVDDYLMPDNGSTRIQPPTTSDYNLYIACGPRTMTSLSTPSINRSIVNGFSLFWPVNTWVSNIAYTLHVEKDNLNYLRNVAINDPGHYYGFAFDYKFDKDITNNDLFIAYLSISTTLSVGKFDIESSYETYDTLSEKSKHRRESYIHFNKLYGDNYETLDDHVINVVNDRSSEITQLQNEIEFLRNNYIMFWDICGDNAYYYTYGNGKTSLVGSGDTYDFLGMTSPICGNLTVKNVIIKSGITSIGNGLFNRCTNIESVSIPNTVTSIGRGAFYMGTTATGSLTSITLPSSVTTLKQGAFEGTALTEITIPSTITSLDSSEFSGCSNLTTVTYNAAVISDSMFNNCYSIATFSLTGSATSIGASSFRGCTSLETIDFDGTLSDWNSITKGTNWDGKSDETPSGLLKIQCTDGYSGWHPDTQQWVDVPNT